MSVKIPIVVGTVSLLEQLQAGDTIAGISDPSVVNQSFVSAATAGQVVYSNNTADTVDLAQANAAGPAQAIGLAAADVAGHSNGDVKTSGVLTLTTGQWTAIGGGVTGLSPGDVYYLDPTTPGNITPTQPSTAGQFVVVLGRALSPTELLIRIAEPVML